MSNAVSTDLISRTIALGFDFVQAIIDDPSIADDIPNGVTLVLIPDDDPELAEREFESAIESARKGQDVYIRHFQRSNTP